MQMGYLFTFLAACNVLCSVCADRRAFILAIAQHVYYSNMCLIYKTGGRIY